MGSTKFLADLFRYVLMSHDVKEETCLSFLLFVFFAPERKQLVFCDSLGGDAGTACKKGGRDAGIRFQIPGWAGRSLNSLCDVPCARF